jgi:phage shock protein PspC (stress-responsive transcriptional regulator)
VARQLVRDPYAKLGGVASGLSHHYGVDVSLVRLAFVIFTLVTGFGLLLYLLAWLIIPRAQYWPPVGSSRPARALSTREIAIGLLLIGVTVGLFVNGGTFSAVLVPVVLVAAGVWLLMQPNVDSGGVGSGGTVAAAPGVAATPGVAGSPGVGGPGVAAAQDLAPTPGTLGPAGVGGSTVSQQAVDGPPPGAMPPGTPVAPRSRRRRVAVIGVLALFVLIPIVVIGGLIAAFVASDFGSGAGFQVTYRPETVEDIRTDISHGTGEVTLDLSQLSAADFDEPVTIDLSLDLGEVQVIIPEGVASEVRAGAGLGDVQLFDESDEGIDPEASHTDDDAEIILDVSVGVGAVTVDRP